MSQDGRVDIGSGVWIEYVLESGGDDVYGIMVGHMDEDGSECRGMVPFKTLTNHEMTGVRWTVEQEDPLTLSPSILRRNCGLHGYIRDGQWVGA